MLRALNYCGPGALMAKCDWNAAYKHFHVKENQLRYNYVSWLGMFFLELCLTFGCISSVGIYDRGARVIIWIALLLTGYPQFLVIQHLDDMVCIGDSDGKHIGEYYKKYLWVCSQVGVSLAGTDNPDKAFAPTTRGQLLGIFYDTVLWIWWLSEEKIRRYTNDIVDLLKKGESSQRGIWEMVGKILYVAPLIPESRYHLSALLKINKLSEDPNHLVKLDDLARDQLVWWRAMIQLCATGSPIPSGYNVCPLWAQFADSDAAGGSLLVGGRGVGAMLKDQWTFLHWPAFINSNMKAECCGVMWRHKLSFLELVGHALHIMAFSDKVTGRTICSLIDNHGSVVIARKGRDLKCPVSDCLVRACNYVATALQCKTFVADIARCSTSSARAVDAISKSEWNMFHELMPDHETDPRRIPQSFVRWLEKQFYDWKLGPKIFSDLNSWGVETLF